MPPSLWNSDLKKIDICWLTWCGCKYLKLLSLIAIQLVLKKRTRQEPKGGRLVPWPVLSYDTVILSPNIWWKWNWLNIECQIFCLKKYTLRKCGLGEAFNQNSLMQLFNGDRRIVHWLSLTVIWVHWRSTQINPMDRSSSQLIYISGWTGWDWLS